MNVLNDRKKADWLYRHGYMRLTDDVIAEWVGGLWVQNPKKAKKIFHKAKAEFSFYRRYGDILILYSDDYLSNIPLRELRRLHWRNVWGFVVKDWLKRRWGVWRNFRRKQVLNGRRSAI